MWSYNYTPSYELYHHGILGQRWGKRNGPPYPLGASDHSASEKKAGWKQSLDKSGSKSDTKTKTKSSEKKGLTDNQKKAIKVGAAVAVTALAAVGGYQLYKNGYLDGIISKGKSAADSILGNTEVAGRLDQSVLDEISQKTGLKQLTTKMSPVEASFRMGEERAEIIAENGRIPGWSDNCTHASVAYILNRMGFDVKPEPINFLNGHESPGKGASVKDILSIFKDPQISSSNATSERQLAHDILKSYGNVDGSYGIIGGKGNVAGKVSNHAFVWENVAGSIKFYNPQQESQTSSMLSRLGDLFDSYTLSRLDGCSLNDNYRNLGDSDLVYERLKSVVSNR